MMLFVARILLGVGEAPTFPAAGKAVSQWIPPASQARANGVVLASIGLGSALAPPLLTALMLRWGWRPAVLAMVEKRLAMWSIIGLVVLVGAIVAVA